METSSQAFSLHSVTSNSTECKPQVLHPIIPSLLSILFLACLVLNSASLWIFWFHIKKWNSGMILQFNLALLDALLIPIVPLMVAYFSLGNNWPFGQFLCQLQVFLLSTHLYGSIYFLTLISIHRYLAVVHYSSRTLWKKSFLKKLSLFVWLVLCVQGLPFFIVFKTSLLNGSVKCLSIHQSELAYLYLYYNMVVVTVSFLLPFGISLTCYALLGAAIAKMSSVSLRGRVMKTKSLQLITVSLAIFVVCFVPLHVCRTMGVIVKYYNLSCELLHQVEIAYYVSWVFTMVNCCLNPLIYSFATEKFNESFSKSLSKLRFLNWQDSGPRLTLPDRPVRGAINSRNQTFSSARIVLDTVWRQQK